MKRHRMGEDTTHKTNENLYPIHIKRPTNKKKTVQWKNEPKTWTETSQKEEIQTASLTYKKVFDLTGHQGNTGLKSQRVTTSNQQTGKKIKSLTVPGVGKDVKQ